jgi:uncharacterized OB-fold protein
MTKKDKEILKDARDYRKEVIKAEVRAFFKELFPDEKLWEKKCNVCGAINCTNNDTCIKCNCQF